MVILYPPLLVHFIPRILSVYTKPSGGILFGGLFHFVSQARAGPNYASIQLSSIPIVLLTWPLKRRTRHFFPSGGRILPCNSTTHGTYPRRNGQAEWAWVARIYTYGMVDQPKVTNPCNNRARRSLTWLMRPTPLPLRQTDRVQKIIHKNVAVRYGPLIGDLLPKMGWSLGRIGVPTSPYPLATARRSISAIRGDRELIDSLEGVAELST